MPCQGIGASKLLHLRRKVFSRMMMMMIFPGIGNNLQKEGSNELGNLVARYPFSLPSSGRRIYPVMGNYRVIFFITR